MMENAVKLEILAPAGSEPAVKAAIFSGADALYMGGSLFSARAMAANFSDEELREAVEFARVRGVKSYVTVNTLIKDRELPEVMAFAAFLCDLSVDGILVQDVGLFRLLAKHCPDLPLHCSTQMSLHSPRGVGLVKELGAKRAVLARELSLEEIREIHQAVDIELEAFVHGALCMSVSGQCYFSAMLGGRSGNRGRCAQTCRLPFLAEGGTGHDLSLKDLSFIEEIGRLKEAGVVSAKIEGRMKRPEYVAAAVTAAREAAEGKKVSEELLQNLEAVFSRSGFTAGYLQGKRGRDMFGIRTREDVVSSTGAVFGSLHGLYKNEYQRVPLSMEFTLEVGAPPRLSVQDREGCRAEALGEEPAQRALNRVLEKEAAEAQLSKLGGTPYYAESVICHTDGLAALPMSVLNGLRRQAVEAISAQRRLRAPVPMEPYAQADAPYRSGPMKLRAAFQSLSQVPENCGELQWVYLPIWAADEDFQSLLRRGMQVGAQVDRALFGSEAEVEKRISDLMDLGVGAFLCGNLGAVALCRELGARIHGSYSLNVTNTQALGFFEEMGVASVEVSMELTLGEIGSLGAGPERGLMIYGRQALMLVRNCPIASAAGGCTGCTEPRFITDRKGIRFPILCPHVSENRRKRHKAGNFAEVFNSVTLSLSDRMNEILGADFGVLRFTVENSVETGEILEHFIRQKSLQCDYTRGLFYRGVL